MAKTMKAAVVREFGKPLAEPDLNGVISTYENATKPVVAAIHGTALGGGCELALSSHYRVGDATANLGLPEVKLGIVPGSGGTQRLPRIIGAKRALKVILSGDPVAAKAAADLGILDAVIDGDLTDGAVAYAAKLVADGAQLRKVRDLPVADADPEVFAEARKTWEKRSRGLLAPLACIDCVEIAATKSFDEGMKLEREIFVKCRDSEQSAAQRHLFFAEREAAKVKDVGKDVAKRPIETAAIVGCGTMGGGIAMCFAQAAVPVTLVDQSPEALHRGVKMMRANWEASCKKGKLSRAALECYVSMVTTAPSLDSPAIREADVVVEAVFERLSIKKSIFSLLDNLCKRGAMLATNTSTLDIDAIAAATSRPEVSLTTLFVPYMSRPTYPVYHCLLLFAGGHWNTLLLAGQCDAAARECAWGKNGAGDDRHRHGHGQAAGEEDGAGWQLLWLHWQPADRILWARGHLHARGGALPLRGRRSDARLRHAHGTAPNVRSRRE